MGLRSVSIVTDGFARLARSVAGSLGAADLAIAEYAGQLDADDEETIVRRVRDEVVGQVVDGLTQAATPRPAGIPTPGFDRERVVVEGSLDDLTDEFHRRSWTDGLPIVPPTVDRVRRFLHHSPRAAGEVIAVLPPAHAEATVWSVAVNGVMAGCRPEYMPVLVALAEAIADPAFRLQDAGGTPGWEALVVLNGPIRDRLDFNHGGGVMRPGRQANTSIGRFLRLYLRNVAGLRTPPGTTDKACIGSPFNVVVAEDDAFCAGLGWQTLAETQGFDRDEDVVTVQSAVLASPPIYTSGTTATAHLDGIADVFGRASSPWTVPALRWGSLYPLLLMSPYIAAVVARAGLTKANVAAHLHRRATVPMQTILRDIVRVGEAGLNLETAAATGTIPAVYAGAEPVDPVPVFPWEATIAVVVAGDPARNQSRGYVSNHCQGSRVSRRVISHDPPGPRPG